MDISGTARYPAWMPALPASAALLAFVSWISGGAPFITELAWILVFGTCILFIGMDLKNFPRFFGVGAAVCFGGFLFWLGIDYFQTWSYFFSGSDEIQRGLAPGMHWGEQSPELIAKASFYQFLFLTFMSIGLMLPGGKWIVHLIGKTPQPANSNTFFVIICGLFAFGLLPYFLFTTRAPHVAIWLSITGMRTGEAGIWTVGRTGTINFSWGGYVVQWLEIGSFAGLLAAFYGIFLAKTGITKVACSIMWLYTLAMAFGTGTRGNIGFACFPPMGMLFIKYQAQSLVTRKWWKPYAICLVFIMFMYPLVVIQGLFRNTGLAKVTAQDLTQGLRDNSMFSHSLFVFYKIPDQHEPFYSGLFPGSSWIMPIPQAAFYFAIGPIPRTLWLDKPTNPAMAWASRERAGVAQTETVYTGISSSLAGSWFATCGIAGIIEGGLLWGWLLAVFDRATWYARTKPLVVLIVLALQTFMFRSFRDPDYNMIYPILIGIAVFWVASLFIQKQR